MALINCPECGEQVSSNAEKCVHCGCTFVVCPECSKAYIAEDTNTCPYCGYENKNVFHDNKNNAKASYSKDVFTLWQEKNTSNGVLANYILGARFFLYLLVVILLVIAWVTVDRWNAKSLDALLKITDIRDKVEGLIVGICIIGALIPIMDNIFYLYTEISCANWLEKKKIDITPIVKSMYSRVDLSENKKDSNFEHASSAAYLSIVPHDKALKYAKGVVVVIFSAVIAIIFGSFLLQNAEAFLASKMYEGATFEFKYIPLLISLGLFGIYKIITISIDVSFAKRKDAWLSKL